LEEVGVLRPIHNVRVGELLTAAGLVTEGDKISAVEVVLSNKTIGQVLLQSGTITNQQLQDAFAYKKKFPQATSRSAGLGCFEASEYTSVPIDVVLGERNTKDDEIARATK